MSLFITKIQIEKVTSPKVYTNTDLEISTYIDEKTGKKIKNINGKEYEVLSSKKMTFAQMKEEFESKKLKML